MRDRLSAERTGRGHEAARDGAWRRPRRRTAAAHLPLPRAAGNRAIGHAIQAKLAVTQPGDPFEREAERVADQVLRGAGGPGGAPIRVRQRATAPVLARANEDETEEVLDRAPIAGVQFEPTTITATRVGPVAGRGGLIRDTGATRLSVVIGHGATLRDLAGELLPLWNSATPFTAPGAAAPTPFAQLTADQLARGLFVYNRYYLPAPAMTEWRVGLRFPLPIRIDPDTDEGVLHPDIVRALADTFDPAWEPLLDRPPFAPEARDAADLDAAAERLLDEVDGATARGIHLSARALTNPLAERALILRVFDRLGDDAFDVALALMNSLVNHQVALLAAQEPGAEILDRIRAILAAPPADLSAEQRASLDRANGMLGRVADVEAQETPYAVPDDTEPLDLNRQTDVVLFAMNLWSEAGIEYPREGRTAFEVIAQVVLNRADCEHFPDTPREVILQPLQFSWTRPHSPVYEQAFDPIGGNAAANAPVWVECLDVATAALNGTMANPGIGGADHYFNPLAAAPAWRDDTRLVRVVGNHRFYRLACPAPAGP